MPCVRCNYHDSWNRIKTHARSRANKFNIFLQFCLVFVFYLFFIKNLLIFHMKYDRLLNLRNRLICVWFVVFNILNPIVLHNSFIFLLFASFFLLKIVIEIFAQLIAVCSPAWWHRNRWKYNEDDKKCKQLAIWTQNHYVERVARRRACNKSVYLPIVFNP